VGRLHQAYGESQQKLPSLYSEAFLKKKVNVYFRISRQHFTQRLRSRRCTSTFEAPSSRISAMAAYTVWPLD
jgi:hypothetical protein